MSDLDYYGMPQAALIAVATWLAVMVMTVLPTTLEATRRGPAVPAVPLFDVDGMLR